MIVTVAFGLVLMAYVLAQGLLPPSADASVPSGTLSQLTGEFNCLGEEVGVSEGNSCGRVVHQGTNNVFAVELSPDGKNAYSVSIGGDLIEYARNLATGALTVIGCVTAANDQCASENIVENETEIANPSAVAVSPDGKDVYVTGTTEDAVVEFERDSGNGLLTPIDGGKGCVSEKAGGECEIKGALGLNDPYGVTVSPDGENVYVTAVKGEAIAELARNTSTGALAALAGHECVGGSISGCPDVSAKGMFEPDGVLVSPDGKNVYVAAGADGPEGAVVVFGREAGGALKQLEGISGCVSESIAECTPANALKGSEDLAISADEQNVYATSTIDNAVVELKRDRSSGALEELSTPNECVTTETIAGCTTAASLAEPRGVAVSPNGESVYVGSAKENGVASFARNSEGVLKQLEGSSACVTSQTTGCGTSNKLLGLKETRRVAISPDSTNLYVAGQQAGAIVELARTVTPTISSVSLDHGNLAGEGLVRINGSGFSEDAGGVKVSFDGTQSPEAFVVSASAIMAKSPVAAHEESVVVRVENEAGVTAEVPSDQFKYTDKPVVEGVTADIGSASGGTTVTITGSELSGASVDFGAAAATVTSNTSESITASTPLGSGTVDVTVRTAHGTSETGPSDKFTYIEGTAKEAGGLFLEGYCQSLGYRKVTLERGEVGGSGFAYENWACLAANGSEVLISNTGSAPSMTDACQSGKSETTYAYPEDPNSAYSWGCHAVAPPKEKNEEAAPTTLPPLAKLGSELIMFPLPIVKVVPPPVLAKTGNVAPVKGSVLVELPGSKKFVELASLTQIPFGTVIEATNGTVSVTSANPNHTTQTGQFFGGQFILLQGKNGLVVAKLNGGNFSVCPTARERAHRASASAAAAGAPQAWAAASGKHVVRKLWANAHGKFSTQGNYAAGAVQGTEWLTEDLCEGTLIRVTRDKVAVTNLLNRKHIEVKTGHKYLAKAP